MKNIISDYIKSIGLDTFGFVKCRQFNELREEFLNRKIEGRENEFEEEDIEKRINPFIYMEDGKTIISIAFPYLYDERYEDKCYFSKYTRGLDYHMVVSKYLNMICEFIEVLGGKAIKLVDSNALPERYIANLAGIGFIGKNNMLITKKYGSYVFLGEIITNLSLDESYVMENQCGECDACIKSCPTNSLKNKDSNICLSYITQKKHIDEYWTQKMNGRIFGCDTCQRVCNFNKNVEFSNINEFKPFEYMNDIDIEELIYLNNKVFNEKYKITSCGWRGKNILSRNAIISLRNKEEIKKIDKKRINSPYLKEYLDIIKKD